MISFPNELILRDREKKETEVILLPIKKKKSDMHFLSQKENFRIDF